MVDEQNMANGQAMGNDSCSELLILRSWLAFLLPL
jgi:hypothetical protein